MRLKNHLDMVAILGVIFPWCLWVCAMITLSASSQGLAELSR